MSNPLSNYIEKHELKENKSSKSCVLLLWLQRSLNSQFFSRNYLGTDKVHFRYYVFTGILYNSYKIIGIIENEESN